MFQTVLTKGVSVCMSLSAEHTTTNNKPNKQRMDGNAAVPIFSRKDVPVDTTIKVPTGHLHPRISEHIPSRAWAFRSHTLMHKAAARQHRTHTEENCCHRFPIKRSNPPETSFRPRTILCVDCVRRSTGELHLDCAPRWRQQYYKNVP